VSFYLTAMLFIVFDIEIVYLYPLGVVLEGLGWFGFAEFAFFIGILALAYVYIWRKGALRWR
jgi:NADH-quinone oxidoreductase subunit A